MITIAGRSELTTEAVDLMHKFRREVFVDRLGWSLPLIEGAERDEYDTDDAVYVLARDKQQRITGCARLLPTASRSMLSDLFSELLGGQPSPRGPAVWEVSRFASVKQTGEGRVLALCESTLELFDAVLTHARNRSIERLIQVTTVAIERLLLRHNYNVHRVASPARIGGDLCVAVYLETVFPRTVDRGLDLRSKRREVGRDGLGKAAAI